jgi:hypothetical protein
MKVLRNGMIHCYVGKLGTTRKGIKEIKEFLDDTETFFAMAWRGVDNDAIDRVIFKEEAHAELFLLRFSGRD